MNSNRKAELQRRLSMTSLPEPPAGLGERLKRDIPDLPRTTSPYATRAFVLRVAASLVLVAGSLIVGQRLLSHGPVESHPPVMIERRTETVPTLPESSANRPADGRGAGAVELPPPPRDALAPSLSGPVRIAEAAPAAPPPRATAEAHESDQRQAEIAPLSEPAATGVLQPQTALLPPQAQPPLYAEQSPAASSRSTRDVGVASNAAPMLRAEKAVAASPREPGRSELVRVREIVNGGGHPHDVDVNALVDYFSAGENGSHAASVVSVATDVVQSLESGVTATTVRRAEALTRELPSNGRIGELAELARMAMRR